MIDRRQLRPIERADLVRLGAARDGGYVVPKSEIDRPGVLLSLGMKQDWSFERAFVAAGGDRVRVVGVDASVGPSLFARQVLSAATGVVVGAARGNRRAVRRHAAVLRNSLDYFGFFRPPHRHVRRMVAGASAAEAVTIPELLDVARARERHGVFLKMDIEGAEYAIVPDIVRCQDYINCLVVEFHRTTRKPGELNAAIAGLLQHFHIVHIHGNNYSAYDQQNDFPDAVEITFVNKALSDDSPRPSRRGYPVPGLDCPNLPTKPDYRLRFD